MTTAQDRLIYPNYFYNPYEKSITRIEGTDKVDKRWTPHHKIRTQWIKHNPEKFKDIIAQQAIYFLPTFVQGFNDMHSAVHNNAKGFKDRWGFDRSLFWFEE